MGNSADVVIIGGGVIGASVAYYLGQRKVGRVILLEKGQLGEGSTSRCIGGIRTQFSTDINISFSLESLKVFENFEEEFGVNPEFRRIGYLFLATTTLDLEFFRENEKLQRKYHIPVEVLDSVEIRKRWPYLRVGDILGGTFCAWDGYAGPSEVLSGFVRGAKRCGVIICEKTEVFGIEVEGDKVRAVRTRAGDISTPVVVNAGGPYASTIGRMVGVEIPVKPLRRQLFVTAPFHLTNRTIPLTIDFHRGWYFRKEVEGMLLSGPIDSEPSFNLQVDYGAMVEAVENGIYRVPALGEARIARGWAGLYEISPDHHAILGRVPGIEGLILANGFSGHGFQHSPAVGKVIAELIVNGDAKSIDISPLSIDRFQAGKLIHEPMTAFRERP